MKIFSMETSLSSSQKPNKFALQPIKACKTFEHFQLGMVLVDFGRIYKPLEKPWNSFFELKGVYAHEMCRHVALDLSKEEPSPQMRITTGRPFFG